MFDVSYQTMLELVGSMREFVMTIRCIWKPSTGIRGCTTRIRKRNMPK